MIQKPKGTIDILPEDTPVWRFISDTARETAGRYGFSEIRTPVFEATELFSRGVGEGTDVVTKEMYTFSDRDARSITLRPEGTASVVRAVIENGKCGDALPLKYFYIYNCFRHEKPQAGRLREFWQFGTEMLGADSPEADAETILLASSFLHNTGLSNVKLRINSIGCRDCRLPYRQALKDYFLSYYDELCPTCRARLETNPLRILDCKSPICSKISENAPKTLDYLCDGCASHMKRVISYLDSLNVEYTLDTSIVRGLDYYTKTVFEFTSDDIGSQSAVGGGGRYDGLVEELGGPNISGVGFAVGLNRIILALKAQGKPDIDVKTPDLYIASIGEPAQATAFCLSEKLRQLGCSCEFDVVGRSLKAQMKYAGKKSAKFSLVIGDNEIDNGRSILKNMSNGEQIEVALDAESIAKTIGIEF